ncbi:hypothetical protein R1flu_004459 [Riccia fluitans]|uniref:DUF676 domain-containing protein n=1 Tax=Riccia fluitans TaxID=41844 RepID=A0ABD1YR54_9MARC
MARHFTRGTSIFSRSSSIKLPPTFQQLTPQDNEKREVRIFYFHGLTLDGKSPLDNPVEGSPTRWLRWLENGELGDGQRAIIYVASYEQYVSDYGSSGRVDLYLLGEQLFKGIMDVLKTSRNGTVKDDGTGRDETVGHVILIGHSFGGLAIKQVILEAAESILDPGLFFLRRLAGVFFFSTPHLGSAKLTRLLDKGKNLGAALAALGKVTDRLNSQFMERRKALGIPTAALFESEVTKMGNFNELVVSEASARMDVDIAAKIPETDHFSICSISDQSDKRFIFLRNQINKWILDSHSSIKGRAPSDSTVDPTTRTDYQLECYPEEGPGNETTQSRDEIAIPMPE